MNRSSRNAGMLLVAGSALAFGVMPAFVKVAYAAGASVYTTLFLRFVVGALCIFPLMPMLRLPMPSRREIITFLLLGGIGYVAQSFFYFAALEYTTASVVALLLYTYPALVVFGSVLVFKEKITLSKAVALVFALAGACVVSLGQLDGSIIGAALALASAASYTIYILINSHVVEGGKGIQSTAFIILGSVSVFGSMNLIVGFEPPTTTTGLLAIIAIGLVSTAFSFWAFLTGLEKVGASNTAIISTLEPVTAVVCSVLFLSEPLTVNVVIGGCLVLAALLITALYDRSQRRDTDE